MNRRFLLADDDADDASIFCEALTAIAPVMECYTAGNGIELFEMLLRHLPHPPDVIFLDINMPVMNGWQCLRKLKADADFRDIPVIMYSTSSAKKDIDMAYNLGVRVFLTKPEDVRELGKILEIVANSSKDSLPGQLKGFKSVKLN
ncbi:MAG TPA: response regulator [Puia sp.]|nr:response regulator [Puia sp.]